jgi:Concanavalin A-like lectin/glucanases superfamily
MYNGTSLEYAVEIGRTNGVHFGGTLDDVRIYNRDLSAQEVQQLYHLGAVTISP